MTYQTIIRRLLGIACLLAPALCVLLVFIGFAPVGLHLLRGERAGAAAPQAVAA